MNIMAKANALSGATVEFLARDAAMLISGKRVGAATGKMFPVYNPANGEVIANVPEADDADVDGAVRAARAAFSSGHWPNMLSTERAKLLFKLADLIETNTAEFVEIDSLDNGKPAHELKQGDIPLAIETIRYMAGWATKFSGRTFSTSLPGEYHNYTLKEPVGVIGQITPWNFPLLMAAIKLAPALAAGCTVVLKPAEQTPLSALRLADLIQEAGFPEGVVNIVTGYGEVAGAALAAHPGVDKISFTGSTEVGRLIVNAASGNLKKVSLELGGKSPAIIFPDADLPAAIQGASDAVFYNQGQCCIAGSRLYVHESVFDEVVAGISDIANGIQLGHGLDPRTQMGPLVSVEQRDRVTGYIQSGRENGASIRTGGESVGTDGYFVRPTVITDTTPDMSIMRDEIFGPVVCAQSFSNDNLEAIAAIANDTDYGLAASVWTRDNATVHKLARKIKAGTVWVNCHGLFDPALPYGGYKQSGWGREMGPEVFDDYMATKSVVVRL